MAISNELAARINAMYANPATVAEQIAVANAIIELQQKVNDLLAKIDADTGVADTNYAATLGVTEITPD